MAKNKTKERPGVVIYFDTLRTLEKMRPEAQGAFLMGCLRYGKDLKEPNFQGLSQTDAIRLETLWEQTQPRIDSDAQGWADGILQRKYAGYCSSCERKGENPMDYDAWKLWRSTVERRFEEDGFIQPEEDGFT